MRLISSVWVVAAMLGVGACGDGFSATGSNDSGAGSGDASPDAPTSGDASTETAIPVEGGSDGMAGLDAPVEGNAFEVGTGEGGTAGPGVQCGGGTLTCSTPTPECCLPMGGGPSCAHQECGCDTQLGCASDKDCQLPMAVCCIGNRQDATCGQGHFVARCAATCQGGDSHLCDPGALVPQCLGGKQCSTDSGDLQNVGLPPAPYGVCK